MTRVSRALFQKLAERALSEVPKKFLNRLYNLEIDVKASPGSEAGKWKGSGNLLGLYSGLKREDMLLTGVGGYLPSRIILYQRNIESRCADLAGLAQLIRTTLRHEIAHHFGFSEDDLRKVWPEGT